MKKALALLLALVMCLSLSACGEKTQTVEITMDNWQEFFEIRPEVEWYQDDFGETTSLHYCHFFAVRPEYLDKIDLDASELIIGSTGVFFAATYEVSWDEQTFEIGNKNNSSGKVEHLGQQTSSLANHEYTFLGDGKLFPLSNCELSKWNSITQADDNGIDQPIIGLNHWILDRIQGTIVIKGELLDLPASTLPSMPEWEEPTHAEDTGSEETPIPEETTTPEPSTEPESVYETIEITIENWQEYFEIAYLGEFREDDFGELNCFLAFPHFRLKDEYKDSIELVSEDVVVEFSYNVYTCKYEIDWEKRTFQVGEIVDVFDENCTNIVTWTPDSWFIAQASLHPCWSVDYASPQPTVTSAEDFTALRIKGTIRILED